MSKYSLPAIANIVTKEGLSHFVVIFKITDKHVILGDPAKDLMRVLGYFEHIYKLPMKFFATRKTGDIITRFSDAFTIKDIFTNIALTLIMDIAMALVTGVILFKMNTELFVIINLGIKIFIKGVNKMNLYKFYFFVNVVVILIESITIYLYSDSLGWLFIMIMSMVVEVMTIISLKKEKDKHKHGEQNE